MYGVERWIDFEVPLSSCDGISARELCEVQRVSYLE